jgi:hypothetical protein
MDRFIEILICPGFSNRDECPRVLRAELRTWFSFAHNQTIFYVLSEAIKNIYDHADSCGQVVLLLKGNQLFFSLRDYNPHSVDFEGIIKRGTTSKPETGYNYGLGIRNYLTEMPREDLQMLSYQIDSSAGIHYTGIWRVVS